MTVTVRATVLPIDCAVVGRPDRNDAIWSCKAAISSLFCSFSYEHVGLAQSRPKYFFRTHPF